MNKLLQVIRREIPLKIISPDIAEPKPRINPLLERIELLRRLDRFQNKMYSTIRMLHYETKWIRSLPSQHMHMDLIELEIAVERYPGRAPWWIDIENSCYLEKQFRSAPKLKNYHVGNYWEQLEHYEKYGDTDTGDNTVEFILDRAKWVYKYTGRQIRLARRLLRIAKNWNFSQEQTEEFEKLYNRLGVYF